MGGIKLKNLDSSLKALVWGMNIGNVFFVDGTNGDDNAHGGDQLRALMTMNKGIGHCVSGHNDHVLCFGAETQTAVISIAKSDVHVIGIGGGGMENVITRGYRLTTMATSDNFEISAAADRLEITGIQFTASATDAILIDDAGADSLFFHHNTIMGSTTASDAVRLDLEGSYATITDNMFFLCKYPINIGTAGHYDVVSRNYFQDVDTAAVGITVAVGDYGVISENMFNMSGTTGDTGIVIVAGANYWTIANNMFHTGLNANITDGGTGTFLIGNKEGAITGATGASIELSVEA